MPFQLKPGKPSQLKPGKPFQLEAEKLNIPSSKDQNSSNIENKPLFFSEEIQKCCERISGNQKTQFNLGETRVTSDPTEAADFVLHREYGSVFDGELQRAVFIPPVFISKQYDKDIPTIFGDVDETIDENYDCLQKNYSTHWLTYQLGEFLRNGEMKNIQGWISKMELLYLINSSPVQSGREFVPSWKDSRGSLVEFSKKCIAHLGGQNPGHELIKDIQQLSTINNKTLSSLVKEKVKRSFADTNLEINPPMVTLVLKYLFGLKYSEVVGEQAERFLFDHLKQSKDLLSDFVIMHSLKIFTSPSSNGNNKEYDFLLLSAERKLIIAIEVKENNSQKAEATKQLEKSKRMFEEKLGEQLDEEWLFYPVIFVHKHFENIQDPNYVVTSQTIGNWLSDLVTHRYPKPPQGTNKDKNDGERSAKTRKQGTEEARKQLQNVMKILVFCLHISKSSLPSTVAPGPLTTSKWVQWLQEVIDTVSTTDTILFYSKEQLAILNSGHPKIIIEGGYGTGKSILLREKAQMLARQGEKVLFAVHPSTPKSLLQVSVEEMLLKEDCYKKNIVVDNYMDLLEIEHKDCHLFIDELETNGSEDIMSQVIEERKGSNKCLWIVFSRFAKDEDNIYQDFKSSDKLMKCFRSSRDVVKAALHSKLVPEKDDDYAADALKKTLGIDSMPGNDAANFIKTMAGIDSVPERQDVRANDAMILESYYSTRKPIIVADMASAIHVALEEGFLFRDVDSEKEEGLCHGILYYITGNSSQADKCHRELSQECLNQKLSISVKAYSGNCSDVERFEPREALQHLRQRNSILVVDSEDIMEGFEWPIVIIDTTCVPTPEILYLPNECFRSMVTFIAIIPQEFARKGFKENEEAVDMSYFRWES